MRKIVLGVMVAVAATFAVGVPAAEAQCRTICTDCVGAVDGSCPICVTASAGGYPAYVCIF